MTKPRTGLAAGLIAGALFVSPTLAQASPAGSVSGSPPTAAQITAFSRAVGINETCAKAYLTVHKDGFPQSLTNLNEFMALAPAADLCSTDAIASAINNTPAPTDAQIATYSQSVGVNPVCIHAFVVHANALPRSVLELNQFQQAVEGEMMHQMPQADPTMNLCNS